MPRIELVICSQCGTRFQRTRHWQKFCSPICRQNFHVEKREKAMRIARELGLLQDPHSWNKQQEEQ
jgi:hypothetical protein